jgi:hypothetical protein
MTQPIDIITSALTSIGALAPGEPLEASLAQEAFTMLNDLLEMVSNEDFMVLSIGETIANIAGSTDWTIGPTGQIPGFRPLVINSAFVRVSNIDYPVSVINVEQYELIGLKQLNGPWPRALWYNSGTPNGTIKFWPKPSAGEIHLFYDQPFTRFTTINDTILFQPGYNMWMRWALAELLMPGYGKTNPALINMVRQNAKAAKAAIKGTNMTPPPVAGFDPMICAGRMNDASFIFHGGFI